MQIELLKIHTHAGVEHGVGTVIDVDDSTANWLIEHGVGQASPSADTRRTRQTETNQASSLTSPKE